MKDLHLIQLFIDFLIILIIFTKLGDQSTIGEREQLRVLWTRTILLIHTIHEAK